MKTSIAFTIILVALFGCSTPNVPNERLVNLERKQVIIVDKDQVGIETRKPLNIRVDWILRKGVYYSILLGEKGTYYASGGKTITFVNSLGQEENLPGGIMIPFDSTHPPWIFIFADYGPIKPGALFHGFITKEGNPLLRVELPNFPYQPENVVDKEIPEEG